MTPRSSRTPTSISSRRPTRPAYDEQNKKQADTADYGNDPQVLVASFTSPYILGPPFVEALKAKGGNNAINDALQNPPASEAAVLDIFTFLDKKVPVPVDEPTLPDGATKVDDGDFGATTWYLMLAQRMDVHRAVKAVDGWAGDSYFTYKEASGTVCVKARYQGKTQDRHRRHVRRPEGLALHRPHRRLERRRQRDLRRADVV